ncbi:AMP-dependent synthetase/ligase [Streptomyces millisiae]|uniref:Acyl-CoA synthetase n=1 Tax=Streptomyces millisiae TaxID=3075542 RepID=A0ABU2M0P0_9ACTN|nr:AMP-dependent synthetase/ligase [Streptomyces sp. DSM 44918]MDT0323374.1 AMP-dependent synthetase/ligase [Streptomyces sp. DSM 44918]
MPQPNTPTATAPPGQAVVPPRLRVEHGRVVRASVPPLVPPVEQGSFADVPYVNAYEAPDDIAFSRRHGDGSWYDVTCAQFATEVTAVAKGLIAHGLRPGDRLAIMSRPRYEWTLLDFAAWAAGLITVPIYPGSSPQQVRWILRDAGVRACAVEGGEEARTVTAVRHELPTLDHLWQLTAISVREGGVLGPISAPGRSLPEAVVAERRALLAPWLAATIVYTSGTTGQPRGCVLTHGNLFAEVDNAIALLYPIFRRLTDEPPATLLFLPLAHVLGRLAAIGCVRARVRLGHAPSTNTDDLLADLAGFRPTFLFAIPHLLEKIFNSGRARAEKLGRGAAFDRAARIARRYGAAAEAQQHGMAQGPGMGLRAARSLYDPLVYRRIRAALGGHVRHVVCGGSPLGRRLGAFFEGAGISIYEGWGLTETTAAATVTPPNAQRLGTVGWPVPGTEVRVARDGEVLVRGGQVFSGYWDAERREVVPATDSEGWLATGDLGSFDDEGYLTITGRKKDLIITATGETVAPAPLEDALRAHPLVSQCVVVGDDRPHLVALITLDQDGLAHWQQVMERRQLTAAELVSDPELRRHLRRAVDDANAESPGGVPIRDFLVLPRDFTIASGHVTPSLKIRREAILRDFAGAIERLYGDAAAGPSQPA